MVNNCEVGGGVIVEEEEVAVMVSVVVVVAAVAGRMESLAVLESEVLLDKVVDCCGVKTIRSAGL